MTTARERAALALLTAPSVHLNGTGKDSLLKGYLDAISALQTAMSALRATHPNGRDYYVQSDSAIHAAMFQHRQRVERVQSVIDQLTMLAEVVAE